MASVVYDYVIVGGGLAGPVVASRLHEYKKTAKILLIEAGQDTRARTDILRPEVLNLGGELDWMYHTKPAPNLNNRDFVYNQGKGLGGGTLINSGGWTRGAAIDFDEWAKVVGDDRWSYKGQLPWFKKTEDWFNDSNPEQHGRGGPMHINCSAALRTEKFPLSDRIARAWDELGVPVVHKLDQNGGDNLGRALLCEARRDGQREFSAKEYSLEDVEVLTDTLVRKIVIEKQSDGKVRAGGVELADGKIIRSSNVICSAGAVRSPQLLMLSGIGPSAHLKQHGIETLVDLEDVGKNLMDHMSFYQFWRLRDASPGYTMGSDNPTLQKPEFVKGVPADWIVTTDVPHDGLAKAIEEDEGKAPDASSHPLLNQPRSHNETLILYLKLPLPGVQFDTEHLTTLSVHFLATSRGSVTLRSAKIEDFPKIDINFFDTEVDKYVFREGLRRLTRLMLGTEFGREYIAGESVPPGVEPVTLEDSDEKLNKRLAATGTTTWHTAGTCSMGKVVDSEFRVRGVEGLRVVDGSVLPVSLSCHIQAALYAMSEQAAAIIAGRA